MGVELFQSPCSHSFGGFQKEMSFVVVRHIQNAQAHTNNRPLQTVEPEKLTRKFYKNNFCALSGNSENIWGKNYEISRAKLFFCC